MRHGARYAISDKQKLWKRCLKEKALYKFNKGRGLHNRHNWCKNCLSDYHKQTYKGKKKEKKLNPYADYTINSDLWLHFYRFGVILTDKETKDIRERLRMAESFLNEMNKIESELGCKDYDLSGIDQRFK